MEEILKSYPQRFAFSLLKWVCPSKLFETIEGDLIEQYEIDAEEFGTSGAKKRLFWNAINFFRLGIISMHEIKFTPMFQNSEKANHNNLNFGKANVLTGWA